MDFIARAGAIVDRSHRVAGFFVIATVVLAFLTMSATSENSRLANEIQRLSREMPVYVVPGSPVGVYSPTRPQMLMTNFAEYVAQSLNTYTYENLRPQYQELQKFLTPEMLTFANAYYQERIEIVRQDEHSSMLVLDHGSIETERIPAPENVEEGDYYKITMRGRRHNILGGTVVAEQDIRITMRVRQTFVSKTNPWGFMLAGYEETQL